MTAPGSPLPHAELMDHARAGARADEARLGVGTASQPPPQPSERSLRGWGQAALLDLEWQTHRTYPPAVHRTYQDAYAGEFHRARAARTAP
jgi:hypothetical protein